MLDLFVYIALYECTVFSHVLTIVYYSPLNIPMVVVTINILVKPLQSGEIALLVRRYVQRFLLSAINCS